MRPRAKLAAQVLISLAVSGAFVAVSLRHTEVGAVAHAIGTADAAPVLGYLAILLLVHLIKTVRWGLLLRPLGKLSFRRLNSASAVGFMLMVVLPLRLGELARPLLVSRPSPGDDSRLPRASALASILVERSVDTIAVAVLGIISLNVLAPTNEAADIVHQGAIAITVAFIVLCGALVAAFFMRQRAVALLSQLLTPVSPALARRAALVLDRFIGGLQLGSARDVALFLLLTAVYWCLHIWGFWWLAQGLDLALTPLMACTVLACQVVGIMIPAGPGMVGTSQFFTQLGVSIFVPASLTLPEVAAQAAAYSNLIWLLQFGQTVLTGLVFLALGHVSLRGLFDRWEGDPLAHDATAEA